MSGLGFILALLFAPFGGLLGDVEGVFVGLLLGYVFGAVIQLNAKMKKLNSRLSWLEEMYQSLKQSTVDQESTTQAATPEMPKPEPEKPLSAEENVDILEQASSMPDTPLLHPAVPKTKTAARISAPQPTSSSAPKETSIDKLFAKIYSFFTDGNVVAKIGVLIVFVGVGAWIKYAYEHAMLPVELRLAFFALLAIMMVVFGWRLRAKKRIYALLLQGGGIGVMYLTVFGAAKIYAMLPVGIIVH